MSAVSLVTIVALLFLGFALWFLVYRIIWSPFTLYFTLEEGGAQDEAAGYSSFVERVSIVIFTDVWLTASAIWAFLTSIYYTVRDNPQVFIGLFLVMGASIVIATYDSEILEAIDTVWHDAIFATYEDVLRPLLVAFRDLYNVLIPWYNLFMAYILDTIIFTVELFVECDLDTWQESIDTLARIFVVTAEELAFWTVRVVNKEGASFNFFRVIKSITAFIETLIDKFGCLCYELSWLWCIAFDILDADSLAISIDQALNFVLCFLDIILDWIIMLITVDFANNPIPNFSPAFDKLCNSTDAFGEWVVVITKTIVQEFITDENVIPDFSCLIGSPLCSVVKVAQALFDLLSNEFDIIKDIEANSTINYLLTKFEYNQVFDELLDTGQCIADVTSFWNVTILNLIGCSLNNTVAFATLAAKLPVDWTFELFAIGPTCFTDFPSSLKECAETYLDFIQDYPFDPILNAARNASDCAFGVLGLINVDFACAGDNFTNAVITLTNITIQMVLHPDLVFTSASFWRTLPFNSVFVDLEDVFRCLGGLLKSFASDPNECPAYVVNFESGSTSDNENVNFWCCSGNSIEGLGVAAVALGQTLFDVLLDLIEDVGVEQLTEDAFNTFTFVVVPNLQIGLDNLACVPLSLFEGLTCPSGGFSNFDDDDDDAHTQVGEALEAYTITLINVTLIPAKLVEVYLGAFLAGYDNNGDCPDNNCKKFLNEFVCPGIDLDSSSQGTFGCIIVGTLDAMLMPFVTYMNGLGALGGCFLSNQVQKFLKGIANLLNSLITSFDSKVVPIFQCTYDFWSDLLQGNWDSLPGDIVNCWNDIKNLMVQILKYILENFPSELLGAFTGIVCEIPGVKEICDLKRDVGYEDEEDEIAVYMQRFQWEGSSRCDRLVQNYPRYVELGLENVGRAEVSHCVMLRVLADSVNNLSPWEGIPLIEQDALDNPMRTLEFLTELPKGLHAYVGWIDTAEYKDVHEKVWMDGWKANSSNHHMLAEIRDLDYYLYQQGVTSRGVITLINGFADFFNRISNMLIRARVKYDQPKAEAMLRAQQQRAIGEAMERTRQQALHHRPQRAVQRQLQLAASREEVQARSSAFATSLLSNISQLLQPRTERAIRNRATLSRFTKRMKQAWQVTFVEHPRYSPQRSRSTRDTCGFPGQSCSDSGDCCPGLVCVDHDNKGKICSTDLCAVLFDDEDDGDRFDCEDVCELQCTGCNWLRDVFCEVYLSRSAEVVFRVATGQFPCLNASLGPTPTPSPTPSPLITKIPPNSFTWQVFTWITRNIFGISDDSLIDIINDIGNFVINTNTDPDDGNLGLAGTIVGFFFCEYSELSACSGPGLEEGLFITFPIYLLITIAMSWVFPATGWLLDFVWMTYIPVLLVVSYEVGYLCYMRMLPAPNLPENLANDLLSFADSVFTPFLNWNAILPGLLIVVNGMRRFLSCSETVGFVNWSDNLVFFLQWQLPSVANFLRTTDYFALRWIRELPFLGDSLDKPQFQFTGDPPDAEKSCFYYTSLNWVGIAFVTAVAVLFIVFGVFLSYLIIITIIAIFTWIAFFGIETARKTRTANLT